MNEYFAKVIFITDINGNKFHYNNCMVQTSDFATTVSLSEDNTEVITFMNRNLISIRAETERD